jgi:flagellar biosynthetic protein FliR
VISLNWLPEAAYLYLLLFARVGTMLMLVPALGERVIPARLRLSFALAVALVFYPMLSGQLPRLPADALGVVVLVVHEVIVGLILGGMARFVVMGAQVAGSVIAFQIGLSVAQTADPSNGGIQGAIIGSFLSFLGITLIFATDLHHLALAAIHDSYMVFSPTATLMFDDAAQMAIRIIAGAFVIGVQMAAPFIVFGLVFYLGVGILGRLMPQLQVFFIAMPATISAGLILLAILLAMMMGWYLMHFRSEMLALSRVS